MVLDLASICGYTSRVALRPDVGPWAVRYHAAEAEGDAAMRTGYVCKTGSKKLYKKLSSLFAHIPLSQELAQFSRNIFFLRVVPLF